jgi:hypothetical protein
MDSIPKMISLQHCDHLASCSKSRNSSKLHLVNKYHSLNQWQHHLRCKYCTDTRKVRVCKHADFSKLPSRIHSASRNYSKNGSITSWIMSNFHTHITQKNLCQSFNSTLESSKTCRWCVNG